MKCPKATAKCCPQTSRSCGLHDGGPTVPGCWFRDYRWGLEMGWEGWLCGQYPGDLNSLLLIPLMGPWTPCFTPQSSPTEATSSATVPSGRQDFNPFAASTATSAFKCSNCAPAAQQIGEQLNALLPSLNPLFLLQHNPLFCLRNVHFRKQLLRLSGLPISHRRSSAFARCRHSQLKCCH